MVRSVSLSDARSSAAPTPTPGPPPAQAPTTWENETSRPPSRSSSNRQQQAMPTSTHGSVRDSRDTHPSNRYGVPRHGHGRSDSEATGATGATGLSHPSSNGYPETTQSGPPRRHDYDLQAMETTLASPKGVARNPIPAPTVTVRSEFPTINRSREQQTLTCLITVEVPDNKWRPDPDDLQAGPPMPQHRVEESFPVRPPSPARSVPRFYPYEPPEVLQEMTENLRNRVDNWHGLDFNR